MQVKRQVVLLYINNLTSTFYTHSQMDLIIMVEFYGVQIFSVIYLPLSFCCRSEAKMAIQP